MVICMDSSISSTAFMEHLFSLVPRPASCMSEREGERQRDSEWARESKKREGSGVERKREHQLIRSLHQLNRRRAKHTSTQQFAKLEAKLIRDNSGHQLELVNRSCKIIPLIGGFFLDCCISAILVLCVCVRAPRQDAHMISPFPQPLVRKYITLHSNFRTVSKGFHRK